MNKINWSTIFSFLLFTIIVLVWYFGVIPQYNRLKETNQQTAVLAAKKSSLNRNLVALMDLTDQMKSSEVDLTRLSVAIPKEIQVSEIFIAVESLAAKTGVAITSLQPSVEAKSNKIKTDITIQTDFDHMLAFMKGLANNLRPAIIENFTVSQRTSNKSGEGTTGATSGAAGTTAAGTGAVASATTSSGGNDNVSALPLQVKLTVSFITAEKEAAAKTEKSVGQSTDETDSAAATTKEVK